jgi:hypothetical protein
MATVTKGRTFVSGEVVTPTKINTLVDSATVTAIVNADIDTSAAIADTKLATIATAGKVSNSATTATSANTASAIVSRDSSGNFSAGTITATTVTGSGNSSFSGTVGIGTSSPSARLQIQESTRNIQIDPNYSASGNAYIQSNGTTAAFYIGTSDSKPLTLITSNNSRITIDAGGSISTQNNPITNCPTTAKAWVVFDGNTSPYTIAANHNVSSVTRVASSNFWVNFTTAFANANYSPQVSTTIATTSNVSNAIPFLGAREPGRTQVFNTVATTGQAPASAADQISVVVFAQ